MIARQNVQLLIKADYIIARQRILNGIIMCSAHILCLKNYIFTLFQESVHTMELAIPKFSFYVLFAWL